MKRFPLVLFFLISASAISTLAGHLMRTAIRQQDKGDKNDSIPTATFVPAIKGWCVAREILPEFEIGTDRTVRHEGEASGYLKSTSDRPTAGILRQIIKSDHYRGCRLSLSGYVRSEVPEGWAGLWMRVDGEDGSRLSLDNMQNRPITGVTEWTNYRIVLDVPENSVAIAFGALLAGKGEIWMDDLKLEIVKPDLMHSTELYGKSLAAATAERMRLREANAKRLLEELKSMPLEPINLDFEDQ
jgi:hypothetical protein